MGINAKSGVKIIKGENDYLNTRNIVFFKLIPVSKNIEDMIE